jgi:superfamily II DNA or RNA helicase
MGNKIRIGDLKSSVYTSEENIRFLRSKVREETDYWARQHNPNIPKYNYLISDTGSFYSGLVPRVKKLLDKKGVDYKIEDKRSVKSPPPVEDIKVNLNRMQIDGNDLTLRDYQHEALMKGLKYSRGIFDIATGGGKSVVMAALILSWFKETLVVIDSTKLAKQLQEELSEYTQNQFGFIGSGIFNRNQFNVAIDKTLLSSSNSYKKKRLFDSVDYLIFDECHHMQSDSWKKISRRCKNASIRHGFSGTPTTSLVKTSEGEVTQNKYLEAYIGPKLFVKTTEELIEEGWLADAKVNMLNNELYFDSDPLDYNEEYKRIIVEDETRNDLICKLIRRAYDNGEKVVGFVKRIKHGKNVKKLLLNKYGFEPDEIGFVHGQKAGAQEMIDKFKDGRIRVLYGTILSEGLNLSCDTGINMEGGKSNIKKRQDIGRILRKPKKQGEDVDKDEKHMVSFWDFSDDGHPYFVDHARERRKIYRSEGFSVQEVTQDEVSW